MQISLEDAQQKQAESDSKQKQAEEDYLFAQRLQEEEDRVMHFCQHEDYSEKARREREEIEDEDRGLGNRQTRLRGGGGSLRSSSRDADTTSLHEDDNGDGLNFGTGPGRRLGGDTPPRKNSNGSGDELNFGTGWAGKFGGDTPPRRNLNVDEEPRSLCQEDDSCWSPKSKGNRRDFSSAKEVSDDDSDDCCWTPSRGNLYAEARRQLRGEPEDDCDDEEGGRTCRDACLGRPRNNCDYEEENSANHGTNRNENRRRVDSEDVRESSLLEIETLGMQGRAESTYDEDRARRKQLKKLKEQEELDLAMVLSLSV